MTPVGVVHVRTVQEARQRREELLRALPFDETEMRLRAQTYELDAEELATYEEVDALDWLIERATQ